MNEQRKLILQGLLRILFLPLVVWLILLLPAGTVDFWQVYAYFGSLLGLMALVFPYFLKHHPEALRQRMEPIKEPEKAQQIIMALMGLSVLALYLTAGFDRRYAWSEVPVAISLLALALVLLSYLGIAYVMKVNNYASRTVKVEPEQELVDSGPYGVVRHPMYSCALIMFLATPVALGSWWALLPVVIAMISFLPRILNEEAVLLRDLAGYKNYSQRVRWRLLPGLW